MNAKPTFSAADLAALAGAVTTAAEAASTLAAGCSAFPISADCLTGLEGLDAAIDGIVTGALAAVDDCLEEGTACSSDLTATLEGLKEVDASLERDLEVCTRAGGEPLSIKECVPAVIETVTDLTHVFEDVIDVLGDCEKPDTERMEAPGMKMPKELVQQE